MIICLISSILCVWQAFFQDCPVFTSIYHDMHQLLSASLSLPKRSIPWHDTAITVFHIGNDVFIVISSVSFSPNSMLHASLQITSVSSHQGTFFEMFAVHLHHFLDIGNRTSFEFLSIDSFFLQLILQGQICGSC